MFVVYAWLRNVSDASRAVKCRTCWHGFEMFEVLQWLGMIVMLAWLWNACGVGKALNFCGVSKALQCLRCWHVSLLKWMTIVLVSAQALDPDLSKAFERFGDCLSQSSIQGHLRSNSLCSQQSWRKSCWIDRSNSQSVLMWYRRTKAMRFTLPWRLRITMSSPSLRLSASLALLAIFSLIRIMALILDLASSGRPSSRKICVQWDSRLSPVTTSSRFFAKQDLGDLHLSTSLEGSSPLP